MRKLPMPQRPFAMGASIPEQGEETAREAHPPREAHGDGGVRRKASLAGTSEGRVTEEGEREAPLRAEHSWSASRWIKAQEVNELIADFILAPIRQCAPSDMAQFTYCKGLTRANLHQLLRTSTGGKSLLDLIEERIFSNGMTDLIQARAPGGADLSAKFASEASYFLEYGGVDKYYSGLEVLIGPPAMDPNDAMEREFCEGPDATEPFTTSNGMTTTSKDEYEFVVRPVEGKAYPERTELLGRMELRRQALRPEHFKEQLEAKNRELVAGSHPPLIPEEQIAGRLYTGPIYEKLNLVLRAKGGNAFFIRRCEELCRGNQYATTIHAVASCVLKLSKLTTATKVYRGLKGAALPASFFEPNAEGVCGGVEFGFMSTSRAKAEALAYATSEATTWDGASTTRMFCPTLLEMEQGMVSRGAEMAWISQYPHEEEVLFSPLLGVEAQSSHVEGDVLIVQLRCTVNVTARTLEQQMSKRRSLVQEMCDNLQSELRANQSKPEWAGVAALSLSLSPSDGPGSSSTDTTSVARFDGQSHARATLATKLNAASSSSPQHYNDDQAWGDAIASAVAASQQVAAWPAGLERLCAAVKLDGSPQLMEAKSLVVGFRPFGRAEAEMLELLLRTSSSLLQLTIHDGGERSIWPEQAAWAQCVAALGRGVARSRSLQQLNLRHTNLHGEAGRLMAEGIRDNTSLAVLRLTANGLEAANLATAINGKRHLQTLAIGANSFGDETLQEVAALVASSPELRELSLTSCGLGGEAGMLLAEAIQNSTALELPLKSLDLAGNRLDSSVGWAIANALQGNRRLTRLQIASNPMSREASAALKEAREGVRAAWRASPEGRAALAREQQSSHARDDGNRLQQIFSSIFGVV